MVALAATTTLLLFNGTIRTNTRSLYAVAPALCFDSVVKATGTLEAVATACPGARRVDLGGATAVPGLTDSHAHIMLEAARPSRRRGRRGGRPGTRRRRRRASRLL